jgi:site-specific DNA-adenine methylase
MHKRNKNTPANPITASSWSISNFWRECNMKYVGGKYKIGKHIANQLLMLGPPDMVSGYVEPFCGSLGVMRFMTDKGYTSYQAYDKHADLIKMWEAVKHENICLPETCPEEEYKMWRDTDMACDAPAERTAIGYGMSFGGSWWGGYARDPEGKRDFMKELQNGFTRILPSIKNVEFAHSDYQSLKPKGKLVYLDPPYQGCKGYSAVGKFNHTEFWAWAEKLTDENVVVVSHPTAPESWVQVWASQKWRTISHDQRDHATERLWIYAPIFDF